ncbi:hypothetical protein GCM10023238_10560 [Streptomyces heliomycini]
MPPDSSSGHDFSQPARPHKGERLVGAAFALGAGHALHFKTVAALSRTLRCGKQREVRGDHADLPGADLAQLPVGQRGQVLAVEAHVSGGGSSRPFSIRSRVDLPEPDRPMTTKISPGSTVERGVDDGGGGAVGAQLLPVVFFWRSRSTAWSGRLPNT